MWWVVTRALKTTTQLALVALSKSVSAIWGMFTLVVLVADTRSAKGKGIDRHDTPKTHSTVTKITTDVTLDTLTSSHYR